MKLKAIRNFWMVDKKRGMNVSRVIGEEFEIDHTDEGEVIFSLLQARKITIIDEKFIPESWRYIVLRSFSYRTPEDFPRQGEPGQEVSFNQREACELMLTGFIKPVDEDGWRPQKLFGDTIKEAEVKRMFDDLPEKKENWATKEHRIKGGHE